jgi:predicted FMN-binding regulatory protein PaiB
VRKTLPHKPKADGNLVLVVFRGSHAMVSTLWVARCTRNFEKMPRQ